MPPLDSNIIVIGFRKACALLGKPSISAASDSASWDNILERLHGDFLQSWDWGEFKRQHGWHVERIHIEQPDGEALAQLLFRRFGPFSIGYLPRGPSITGNEMVACGLLDAIDRTCDRHRAILLVVDPGQPLPPAWIQTRRPFTDGPESFQTWGSVKVPLLDDARLLSGMRKDTRYNIQYARRHGVMVEHTVPDEVALTTFYNLLQETSERNGFGIHERGYYENFLRIFGNRSVFLFSWINGVPASALIAVYQGLEGRSMYAGSSTAHRQRGDAALLRFEAMRWARDRGCSRFDLGGIASDRSPTRRAENAAAESRSGLQLAGVDHFKMGFGGQIVAYPPTVERRYHPGLAWLIRRLNSRFRTAPQRFQQP